MSPSALPCLPLLLVGVTMTAAEGAFSGDGNSAIGFWAESQLNSRFTLGNVRKEWDEAERYEIGFRTLMPAQGKAIPFMHVSLFYEGREWEERSSKVDYEAFGLSVGGGAELRMVGKNGDPVALGLVPWGRFGLATQSVIVHNVLEGDLEDRINGSFRVGRFDLGAGIDLRLTIARRLVVELGVGADYWHSANVSLVVSNNGGGAAISSSYNFYGYDVFARLGAAISF